LEHLVGVEMASEMEMEVEMVRRVVPQLVDEQAPRQWRGR